MKVDMHGNWKLPFQNVPYVTVLNQKSCMDVL